MPSVKVTVADGGAIVVDSGALEIFQSSLRGALLFLGDDG